MGLTYEVVKVCRGRLGGTLASVHMRYLGDQSIPSLQCITADSKHGMVYRFFQLKEGKILHHRMDLQIQLKESWLLHPY